jgi:hypothetical protein
MSGSVANNPTNAASVSLRRLLADRAAAGDITRYLDELPGSVRSKEVLGVTGNGLKHLYDTMEGAPPASLEELVPPDEEGTITYEGRNSLPVFSRFQKRFARIGDVVVGYNHQILSFVTGPGYFVALRRNGEGQHGDEVIFDYTVEPPRGPDDWPPYKPNDAGLARQVFGNLNDYVRRVGRGVVVGKAYKQGVDQDTYFSLSRAI